MYRLIAASFVLSAWLSPGIGCAHEGHDHAPPAERTPGSESTGAAARQALAEAQPVEYARSQQVYAVPDVKLINADSKTMRLVDIMTADGPVIMQFIETGCAKSCARMSEAFAKLESKLGGTAGKLRMISISADPENDGPAQLNAYAKQYGPGHNWQFFTGNTADIETVLRAFGNHSPDKRSHELVTLLRPARGKPWLRLEGRPSADELAREYRAVMLK